MEPSPHIHTVHTGAANFEYLLAQGFTRKDIEREVEVGTLSRIARGWFATPGANPDVLRAVQLGGSLACLSAARVHGLWVPPPTLPLHVALHHRHEAPAAEEVLLHRSTEPRPCTGLQPIDQCAEMVIRCHEAETSLMVLESAVSQQMISSVRAKELIAQGSTRKTQLRWFEPGAQSGTETRVRLFFRARNVRVRPQVFIPGVGRVDLLIGDSWIIECDSRAHHTGTDNYSNDRRRDLAAKAQGFEVLRLTYEQVMFEWSTTQAVLSQLLAAKVHLKTPRPRV